MANLDAITNAEQRSGVCYAMTSPIKHAGQTEMVAKLAAGVTENPQLQVYAWRTAARAFLEAGDERRYLEIMQAAESIAIEGERARDLVTQYLKSGHLHRAKRLALRTPNRKSDPRGYVNAYLIAAIPEHLAAEGDLDAAFRFIDQHARHKKTSYGMVAYAVARTGDVAASERAIAKVGSQHVRDNTYTGLVEALIRQTSDQPPPTAGDLSSARAAAEKIVDEQKRARAFAKIAAKQPAGGAKPAELRAAIAVATTREEKVALSRRLVTKLIELDKPVEAEAAIVAMIAAIKETPREPKTTKFGTDDDEGAIASARWLHLQTLPLWAQRDDKQKMQAAVEQAIEGYQTIANKSYLGVAFMQSALINAMLVVGDSDGARRLLREREAKPTYGKLENIDLANGYLALGDYDKAEKLLADLPSEPGRGSNLGCVATGLIKAGEFDRAKRLLATLGQDRHDLEAYRAVARHLVDSGDAAELQAWLPDMPSAAARVHACVGAISSLNWAAAERSRTEQEQTE